MILSGCVKNQHDYGSNPKSADRVFVMLSLLLTMCCVYFIKAVNQQISLKSFNWLSFTWWDKCPHSFNSGLNWMLMLLMDQWSMTAKLILLKIWCLFPIILVDLLPARKQMSFQVPLYDSATAVVPDSGYKHVFLIFPHFSFIFY